LHSVAGTRPHACAAGNVSLAGAYNACRRQGTPILVVQLGAWRGVRRRHAASADLDISQVSNTTFGGYIGHVGSAGLTLPVSRQGLTGRSASFQDGPGAPAPNRDVRGCCNAHCTSVALGCQWVQGAGCCAVCCSASPMRPVLYVCVLRAQGSFQRRVRVRAKSCM
jgi:hypothetical protein